MVTDMTTGKPSRVLLKFSLPMLASVAFQQLYNIVDSVIAGNFVSDMALGAIGASYPVTMIFIAIATGGSVVYGRRAMKRLHEDGVVVYIRLPYQEIERRLSNLATRGVTLREGQTLFDLYEERIPLYEKEADVVLDASGLQIEQTVEAIARRMETMNGAGYGI